MRIMLDTNVLLSVLLFPNQRMNCLMSKITTEHHLVMASYVVDELKRVVRRKFPDKELAIDMFLSQLAYELVYTPEHIRAGLFEIRDVNDYPILYTAIAEDVDILITGDEDFIEIEIVKPVIIKPAKFLLDY